METRIANLWIQPSLQCRRYWSSERSINGKRVYMPPFWMLNGRGLERVILSVPFNSLQPSALFPIQDGGRNSRTKDYSALAPHKNTRALQARFSLTFTFILFSLNAISLAFTRLVLSRSSCFDDTSAIVVAI